ncbi:MAG: sporulation protein [Ruminococcaceae bacterium]|nr:sporulation protein [Oscillospiraceae bacterium]
MKNNDNRTINPIREKIADTINISKEIILNTSKITLIGNKEITIENYRGITEYTCEKIRLISSPDNIEICGCNLCIKTMTKDFLYITGSIGCVSFCPERK